MRPLEVNTRIVESTHDIVVDQDEEDSFDQLPGMHMKDFPRTDSSSSSFSRKLSFGEVNRKLIE